MSRTVCMVQTVGRRRSVPVRRPYCTACGNGLIDGMAVVNGRLIRNALICSGCQRVGVACACERAA